MNESHIDILKTGALSQSPAPDGPGDLGVRTDRELLDEYLAKRSESAFAEIVARHSGFVYAAALRQVANPTTAEEITQAVFVVLARKASILGREKVLTGWLFRAVRYAALDARKIEIRRNRRELEAARMQIADTSEEPETIWTQMAPLVDDALASLSEKDRHVILLRFFEAKSFRDIGEMLGGNENSARLRVVRALEKLRVFFHKRGMALSSALISSALLVPSSQAAPATVVHSVMGIVASGSSSPEIALLVQSILRRLRRRSRLFRVGPLALVLFFVLLVSSLLRTNRSQIPAQVRATTMAIDNAISFGGDPDLFIAQIHFRNPQDEQFKPVFAAFVRASAGLRKQVRDAFGNQSQSVRAQIWLWTVQQLFENQPRRNQPGLAVDRVTDDFFQPYLLVMVKAGSVWKWDFFSSLPPRIAAKQMAGLEKKTALCERAIRQIRDGTITNAEQTLALIQGKIQFSEP